MSLEIKLQVFEGPLDLLMHLIDKNQIDIYDIPIVTITEQYMEYINAMQKEDMEVTSEFLVMAATLIDIKCKMLLPKEVNEDGEEEDPRAELVEKLLEYKMYKYMAYELKDRQMDADMQWFREKNIPKEVKDYEVPIDFSEMLGDATLTKLNEIFQELLKRQEDKVDPIRSKFGNIEKEEIDMDAKTLYIKAYIREHSKFSFKQLLEKQHSKTEIIVTFLVILEEMKLGDIEIEQETTFGDIIITSRKAS
ncbi:segregation and condensation protein A [Butyrivibrio hungatei]|uniref:Segregation and condensation protein A n=1 Tax=Butyrivibrio hungatei TaxID=185008 RepID=A0A1D9P0U5_9FIRM|nr:segregation/condensation protein A [Butyrivibrio hungatei]AOZ96180.1 chromosome segregation and condensation protein ScpA [Butyrivibrio hungatei]